MEEGMEPLVPALKATIDPTFKDSLLQVADLGVDSLMAQIADGACSNVPIVSSIYGVIRTGCNIHDRNLLKQLVTFLNELNADTIDPEQLNKYKKKLEDPQKAEEELGRIIIILNATIDSKKSQILARFYRARIYGEIGWDEFCELSDITSRLFLLDIALLQSICAEQSGMSINEQDKNAYRAERLISLGLVRNPTRITYGDLANRHVWITDIGMKYCNIGLSSSCVVIN